MLELHLTFACFKRSHVVRSKMLHVAPESISIGIAMPPTVTDTCPLLLWQPTLNAYPTP